MKMSPVKKTKSKKKRFLSKEVFWVVLSLVISFFAVHWYPVKSLESAQTTPKIVLALGSSTATIALAGIFLTILFGGFLNKVVQKKQTLTAEEKELHATFKFTLLSSTFIFAFLIMAEIWSPVLGVWFGDVHFMVAETKWDMPRFYVACLASCLTVQMFSIAYALYPLLASDYKMSVEQAKIERKNELFTRSDD